MLAFYLTLVEDPNDKSAFETLYIKYRKQMFYLAKTILPDDGLAEDAVHDVFVAIATKHMNTLNKIEEECDVRNYLLKATKNTCLNYIRKNDKANIPMDVIPEIPGKKAITDKELWEHIYDCMEAERVVAAITALPTIYRDVLYYHFVVGLTGPEIANTIGKRLSTVKKRLVRGKTMLLNSLENEKEVDYDKNRV